MDEGKLKVKNENIVHVGEMRTC